MLTVVCLYVRGPYPYTAEYVTRMQRMVRTFVTRPHRFVCLTDRPKELPGIETIRIESMAGVVPRNGEGYWNKLRMFDPAIGLTGRVLYLDLDTVILSNLDPIIDFPASLALTADAFVEERKHLDTDRFGRKLHRRFNGSVIVFDGGTHGELWLTWTPKEALRLSTDQDWIGEQAADAQGMPLFWFPRISRVHPPYPPEAKVLLVKKPKNHIAAQQWPWFEPMWGAA